MQRLSPTCFVAASVILLLVVGCTALAEPQGILEDGRRWTLAVEADVDPRGEPLSCLVLHLESDNGLFARPHRCVPPGVEEPPVSALWKPDAMGDVIFGAVPIDADRVVVLFTGDGREETPTLLVPGLGRQGFVLGFESGIEPLQVVAYRGSSIMGIGHPSIVGGQRPPNRR